jgi:mRNA-degrading endonuclease RelE of RelBE toxin-antitoxin system
LRLRFHKDAEKALKKLSERSPEDYRIVRRKLEEFAETGRGDVKQVAHGLFRLRVGNWRAYFGRRGGEVLITDIVFRPRAYRHEVVERALRRLEAMYGVVE